MEAGRCTKKCEKKSLIRWHWHSYPRGLPARTPHPARRHYSSPHQYCTSRCVIFNIRVTTDDGHWMVLCHTSRNVALCSLFVWYELNYSILINIVLVTKSSMSFCDITEFVQKFHIILSLRSANSPFPWDKYRTLYWPDFISGCYKYYGAIVKPPTGNWPNPDIRYYFALSYYCMVNYLLWFLTITHQGCLSENSFNFIVFVLFEIQIGVFFY